MKVLRVVFGCGLVLCASVAASALPLPFNGAFRLQIGTMPAITSTGAGVGDFAGAGGAASIPAGVFSIHTTAPLVPPILNVNGFAAGATGQGGNTAPFAPGTSKALSFGGVTGTMGLDASAYFLSNGKAGAGVKIGQIGFGCLPGNKGEFGGCGTAGLPPMATMNVFPYQLGMITVMGAFQGVPSTVMGTGFDNRTAGGQGVLQLVTPAVIYLGSLGSFASIATVSLTIVPEPATAILVGCGLVGLGVLRSRLASQ